MSSLAVVLCCLALVLPLAYNYPTGAIPSTCNDMLPNHGVAPLQGGNGQFDIKINGNTYAKDQTLKVTLSSRRGDIFQGFLLRAENSRRVPVGRWQVIDPRRTKTLNCGQPGDSITHAERINAPEIVLEWIGPRDEGPIGFRGTVVQNYGQFYMDVTSNQLVFGSGFPNYQRQPPQPPGPGPNRPPVKGYARLPGDCPNAPELERCQQCTSPQACGARCVSSPACPGFSFNFAFQECILRSQDCQQPQQTRDSSFYRKSSELGCGTTNEGQEFWIMFMENTNVNNPNPTLELFAAAGKNARGQIQVRVTSPEMQEQAVTVQAGGVQRIEVPANMKLEKTQKARKGIKITATEDIVIYGVNKNTYSTDGFLGLPVNAIGNEYYVVTYFPPTYNTEFGIAATQDNTNVEITLPQSVRENVQCNIQFQGQTVSNGQTITMVLNQFDCFEASDNCDLSGTFIKADKPISVFSGNQRTKVGQGISRDHLVEQLTPTTAWGKDFAIVPIPKRTTGDIFYFVASEDNTDIDVRSDQSNDVVRLNRGQSAERRLDSNSYYYIKGTNPILVIQIVYSQVSPNEPADPTMIIATPIQQWGFGYAFTTPSAVATTYTNYLVLTIEQGQDQGLLLDGQPLNTGGRGWRPITGTTKVGSWLTVAKGTHHISHQNNAVPFGAYMYGAGDQESYGFPAGMCIQVLTCKPTSMVIADNKDNDCDGNIDEEVCENFIDDDGDGLMDEDCYMRLVTTTPAPRECEDLQTRTICFGKQDQLTCGGNQVIQVASAHFGRIGYANERTCQADNPLNCGNVEENCGFYDIYPQVSTRCDGQTSCDVPMNSYFVGSCADYGPCKQCAKYAYITWMCISQQRASRCRVLNGLQYKENSNFYYSGSSFTDKGTENSNSGFCAKQSMSPYVDCSKGNCMAAKYDQMGWNCQPHNAQYSSSNLQAWCPALCDLERPYLRIDLGAHYEVTGYIVQGRRRWDHWATELGFQHSNDAMTWTDLLDFNGQPKKFEANSNSRIPRMCTFAGNDRFRARYVKIFVRSYNQYPALHIDLLRCSDYIGCPSVRPANTNHSNTGIAGLPDQVIDVGCNIRFMTPDRKFSFRMQCMPSGQWNGQQDCSVPRECPNIPRVQGALHNGQSTKINAQVTYTCQQGRVLGGGTINCQQNGEWTPPPRCG